MNREEVQKLCDEENAIKYSICSSYKPYRIKHIPSGLYFSPRSNSGNNLTRRGKVYTTKVNGFNHNIYLKENSMARKVLLDLGYKEVIPIYPCSTVRFDLPEEEFKKEYL